ncbi:MAG TPA: hypothetical protein VKB76_19730, partial [Ktedonobacterales bacterium]|nr:hypothetical protein [Ktedonobacterales bacterium]
MSKEVQWFPDTYEGDEVPDDLAPVIARLHSDAENWQRSIPSAHELERFVAMLQDASIEQLPQDAPANLVKIIEFDDQKIAPAIWAKATHSSKLSSRRSARRRSLLAPVAALLLVLLSVVIFSNHLRTPTSEANRPDPQTSYLTPIPAANPLGMVFQQFSIVGAGDIWAAGYIPSDAQGATRGVIAHYIKGTWTIADGTSFQGIQLVDIQMRSDTDGWVSGVSVANPPSTFVL